MDRYAQAWEKYADQMERAADFAEILAESNRQSYLEVRNRKKSR